MELDFYSKNWKKNKLYQTVSFPQVVEPLVSEGQETYVTQMYAPRGAQIEALYHLKKTTEEGFDKGMAIMGTGAMY